jgi:hypothetical protein
MAVNTNALRLHDSLADRLARSGYKPQGVALAASQLEAWEFVKRINLSALWNQPIGLGSEFLQNLDWVQRMMPPVAAVYFICVEDETGVMPVYIGMTKAGLDRRVSSRHHGAIKAMREYRDQYLCLRYVPLSEGMNIEDLEVAAISWWEPPLNVHQPMPSRKEIQIYVEELRAILA